MSIACMDSREKPTLGDIEHIWWGLQIQDYVGELPHNHALIWLPMGSSEEHKMLVTTTVMNGSLFTLFTPSTKAWVTQSHIFPVQSIVSSSSSRKKPGKEINSPKH